MRRPRIYNAGRFVVLTARVRLEGLGQLKNSMTSSGIEAATFQLVAQCLNQLLFDINLNSIIYKQKNGRDYIVESFKVNRF
jgi:hypothetical protein